MYTRTIYGKHTRTTTWEWPGTYLLHYCYKYTKYIQHRWTATIVVPRKVPLWH